MPAPETSPSTTRDWLEPVLWSTAFIAAFITAAVMNETAREVTLQGLAYFFTFVTSPFILEASCACVGIFIVFAINHRRIAREGDGWVMMEVKVEDAPEKKETEV